MPGREGKKEQIEERQEEEDARTKGEERQRS
jgi:hypothetical protein